MHCSSLSKIPLTPSMSVMMKNLFGLRGLGEGREHAGREHDGQRGEFPGMDGVEGHRFLLCQLILIVWKAHGLVELARGFKLQRR